MTQGRTKTEVLRAVTVLDDMLMDLLGLSRFHRPIGGDRPNHDEFCRYVELAILCAEKLAPYQSPKFRQITPAMKVEMPGPDPLNIISKICNPHVLRVMGRKKK